ncbi:MAG: DUF420 domain-containing protein [Planctomycetes bacterium]|nr:DUF420 domain-containing protein [Planctomycetota bacterium]
MTMLATTMIDFPGWDGFLGTRASLALDVVCLGMVIVVFVLGWSIWLVRVHRRFALHRRVQLGLAGLLLVVLTAFELDVRMNGWRDRAAGEIGGQPSGDVFLALWIHLFFAVTTVVLWIVVIFLAWRRFPNPPEPNSHSEFHRRWGKIAAVDMLLTSITGWVFYVLAFV